MSASVAAGKRAFLSIEKRNASIAEKLVGAKPLMGVAGVIALHFKDHDDPASPLLRKEFIERRRSKIGVPIGACRILADRENLSFRCAIFEVRCTGFS